jgi:hypothetical protein
MKLGDRLKAKLARALRRYRFAKHRPKRFSKAEIARRRHRVTKWTKALSYLRKVQARRRSARAGRAWGGSRAVTNEIIRHMEKIRPGVVVTSRKRWETFGNPSSDHYMGNKTADAVDFALANDYGAARQLAARMGGSWGQDYGSFHVKRNGKWFRVQLIAGTHGTGPHLHAGVAAL